MSLESLGLRSVFEATWRLRFRLLYPGLPFVFVPTLIAGLVASQFSGGLTHFPAHQPAALRLPWALAASETEARQEATLLVVPKDSGGLYVGGVQGQRLSGAWLSVPEKNIGANSTRVRLDGEGLDLDSLRGIDYPLVIVVEGALRDSIQPAAQSSQSLPELELVTPEATWIVLFLMGGAVFGVGASTGFLKNGPIVE